MISDISRPPAGRAILMYRKQTQAELEADCPSAAVRLLICLICVCCRAPPWRTSAPSWGTSLWRRRWPRSERCSSFATCPTPTVTLWKLPWWMLHTNTYTQSWDIIGMMIKPHLRVSISISPSRWFVPGALYKANEEKLAPLNSGH